MAIAKRKRKFFNVEIPLISKETQLQAYEPKELAGRLIKYDLTRILRGKSMILQLKAEIKDNKIIAVPRKIKLMPYFLRRAVRKGTNYIEDSFSAECKDAQLRIKPFLVSRRKVSRAVRKALREKAREELTKYIKDKTSEKLFEEILKNQLQKPLSLKLKKIYPLALCEIRVLEIEKDLEQIQEIKEKKIKEKIKKEDAEEIIEEIESEEKTEKLIKDKSKSKDMEEDKIENAAEKMTKDVKIENVEEPAEKKEVKKEIEKEVEEVIEKVEENKE